MGAILAFNETEETLTTAELSEKKRKINLILFYGRKVKQLNFLGNQHGAMVDRDHIFHVLL